MTTSNNPQNGGAGQSPTEFAANMASGSATPYGFIVQRVSSNRNVHMEICAEDRGWTSRDRASLANLADVPVAMTVAALDVNVPYPQESYSSEGPTNGPGGTASGGAIKPDIAGFANVSTVSYPNPAEKFNGTLSATPHVAGAAALVKSAYPAYTPAQIQDFLKAARWTWAPWQGYDLRIRRLPAPPVQATDVSIVKRLVGSNRVWRPDPVQTNHHERWPRCGLGHRHHRSDAVASDQLELQQHAAGGNGRGPDNWNLAALAAGASGTITINGKLSAGLPKGWVFINTATISAPNDSNATNNSGRVIVGGKKNLPADGSQVVAAGAGKVVGLVFSGQEGLGSHASNLGVLRIFRTLLVALNDCS